MVCLDCGSREIEQGKLADAGNNRDSFFFQAEDDIRGAQESRVLGDVYKGQDCRYALAAHGYLAAHAVSYTHLTLPTTYSV